VQIPSKYSQAQIPFSGVDDYNKVIYMSTDGSNIIVGTAKQILVIPFNAVLPALTNITLLAGKIGFRYRVVEAEIVFTDDANNLLLVYFFTANNSSINNTVPPPDSNIFSRYSPTPYFIGEGLIKHVECNVLAGDNEFFIKLYASNLNNYPQVVNASIKIEEV
jgi:hypothetical protein